MSETPSAAIAGPLPTVPRGGQGPGQPAANLGRSGARLLYFCTPSDRATRWKGHGPAKSMVTDLRQDFYKPLQFLPILRSLMQGRILAATLSAHREAARFL